MNKKKTDFEHILSMLLGLLILYWVLGQPILLVFAFIIGLTPFLFPDIARKIAYLWDKTAEILGKINGSIILSILFFLILTPIAFLYRLGNRHSKFLLDKKEKSAFIERNHEYKASDLENMW